MREYLKTADVRDIANDLGLTYATARRLKTKLNPSMKLIYRIADTIGRDPIDVMADFGRRPQSPLDKWRIQKRLTVNDFSRRLGVTRQTAIRLLRGDYYYIHRHLRTKIIEITGLPEDVFLPKKGVAYETDETK